MKVITEIIVPLVTAGTAVAVFFVNRSVSNLDGEMKKREQARADLVVELSGAQQSTDLRFRVYDAVTTSLQAPDDRRQRVAIALVSAVLTPEDSLRASLLGVLAAAGTDKTQARADTVLGETRAFTQEQQIIRQTSAASAAGGDWRKYRIDVFWCVARGATAERAAASLASYAAKHGAAAPLRVRRLPISINASPGYGISGYVIRREQGEDAVAREFKTIADTALHLDSAGFTIGFSRQPTPGYLSAFIC